MSQPVLDIRRLRVSYAGNRALDLDALSVAAGEVVGVVGANGAGKSTLVNAVAGWSRGTPSVEAQISLDGRRLDAWPTHQRVRAGLVLVPEGRVAFGRMSVDDNLCTAFTPAAQGADEGRHIYSRDEVYALFPRLHERRHHLGHQLSGGERQMLGIGRALMMGPRLLMLDEPSLGIAPKVVAEIADAIRRLNQGGMSIVLVEQNARLALRLAHNAYALEHGEVVKSGKGDELLNDPFVRKAYLGV